MEGRWLSRLLYEVCRRSFFSRSTDDGVVHQQYFNPVSGATIALVFTAVSHTHPFLRVDRGLTNYQVRVCLDEWRTGKYLPVMFETNAYEPVYREHLANLLAMDHADPFFLKGLGTVLWNDCM